MKRKIWTTKDTSTQILRFSYTDFKIAAVRVFET